MKTMFLNGGLLFMGTLTLLLIFMLAWAINHFTVGMKGNNGIKENALRKLSHTKSIGLFAMIMGILGQLIGLYSAFVAIEAAGDISPALVFGGLKASMITTIYGISIYLVSILIWFVFDFIANKRKSA